MTNQPAAPTFDAVTVTNTSATVSGSQLLVKWQIPATSSPQLAYKIEVFNNSSYTGSPVVTVNEREPEVREKLITVSGVATPYVRLTISDIFDNSAAPISIAPAAAVLNAANNVAGTVAGLGYQYYEAASGTSWTVIPDFSTLNPVLQGAVNGLDLTPRKRRSNYAFHFTGYVNVPTDGLYEFTANSSHGSTLSVDGTQVVNDDGVHDILAATGSIGLKAGLHALDVQYFFASQNSDTPNSDSVTLTWQGPGIAAATIPMSAYFRVPVAGEASIVLNSPANNTTILGTNVAWAATATANGTTLSSVDFMVGNRYWGQALSAPYNLNSFFWASANNPLFARLHYNTSKTIDSPVNLVTTTNMDVSPWQFIALGPHNDPVGVSVQGSTAALIGDAMNMVYRQVKGDCTIIAHLADLTSAGALPDGSTPDSSAEAGIIMRATTNVTLGYPVGENGTNTFQALFSRVGGTTHYQDGTMYNGGGQYPSGDLGGANRWYKIQRVGDTFTGSLSTDGVNWTVAGTQTLTDMGDVINVGLFSFIWPSLSPTVHHAAFDNVSISGNVIGAPTVSASVSASAVNVGSSATFTAAAVGASPYTYQWYLNGSPISGATSATLTIPSAQLPDSGLYTVSLGTANGSATSAPVSLSVQTPVTTGYAATTGANGPVAYWRMGETSGTIANDSAGNYDGTYSNVTLGTAGPQPPTFAGFESNNLAANFNGTSSSVTIPPLNLNSNNVTIAGWVKRSGTQSSFSGIFFNRSGSTTAGLHFGSANELRYTWNGASNTYNWNSGLVPPDGQWTFVALVVQPTKATIYMSNGATLSPATNSVNHAMQGFTGNGYLGQDSFGGRWFKGSLDEFAVYNQALTSAQVQSLYQASSAAMPSVTLTAPATGTGYSVGTAVNLTATASYAGHTITKVQFYSGATLLGEDNTSPYSFAWTNASAAKYTVYAVATFDDGSTMSSAPAFIEVHNPPPTPTGLFATALSSDVIDVSWTASPEANSYVVRRNGTVVGTVSGTVFLDRGLAAGTNYTYTVTASNPWGTSAATVGVSASTLGSGTALVWDADLATAGAQDGSGNWGAGYPNWLNGAADVAWPDNVQAVFGAGTGSGNTVTLANSVTPSGISFAAGAYTIASSAPANVINVSGNLPFNCQQDGTVSAALTGAGSLIKNGPGTLTLSGSNAYTGGTTISAGALQISGSALAGNVTNNAAVVFNTANSATYGGIISGMGTVSSIGSGTQTLTSASASTYSGGTTVTNGILSLGAGGSGSPGLLGTGQVTLNADGTLRLWLKTTSSFTITNRLFFNGGTLHAEDAIYTMSGAITVGNAGGAIETKYAGKTLTFSGSLSGSGNLTLDNASNAYGATYLALSADNSGYTGTLTVNAASTGWNGGQLMIKHNNALKNADLIQNTPRDISFGTGITAPIFGSLAGVGNLTIRSGVALNVGNNGHSTTYSGALSGAGSLNKTGGGTLTLSGTNTYTSTTTVSAGALAVTGSLGSGSAVTVAAGGTLSGTGTLQGTVAVNGAIAPGSAASIGTLTISNSLTLRGAANFRVSKSGSTLTCDAVSGVGVASYGGSLVVTNFGTAALAAGDTFTLVSATSYSGSFASFSLPALPSNLQWDTSKLSVNGSIAVMVSPWGGWQAQHFTAAQLADSFMSGLSASPARDGISNLMKFALGLDPATPSELPIASDVETIGGIKYLRLTVNRNSAAVDVGYLVEVTGDLTTGGWSSSGTTVEMNTSTQLVVRDNTPLTSASSRFIHLKVTHP
jgi:autotransporter-associated beta strand protein